MGRARSKLRDLSEDATTPFTRRIALRNAVRVATHLLGTRVAVFVVSRWKGALDRVTARKVLNGEYVPVRSEPPAAGARRGGGVTGGRTGTRPDGRGGPEDRTAGSAGRTAGPA
ncbi:hypothetical protein [Streptomyces sp. NPDC058434]|uniref:hypothetical protein n=1 Tax=Streptomyces sp. NPDC058434 TaxID=3346498 RepID=UPI00365483FB